MTTQSKSAVPGRSRHPGHTPAPQDTRQKIAAVITDVLLRLAGAPGLSAAHRAVGQRLLKAPVAGARCEERRRTNDAS
jgi:hypothetical protein